MSVFTNSIEYVSNDLKKKYTNFMMEVMTVFLKVSFITILGGIGQLGPITTTNTAIYHSADFDVMFLRRIVLAPTVIVIENAVLC